MLCIVGGRQTGKTQRLINLSHDTGYPIMTRSRHMAVQIELQAQKTGKTIPKPIAANWYAHNGCIRRDGRKVFIDEAQGVLSDLLGVEIVGMAIDGDALKANPAIPDFDSMGFIELVRNWRDARKEACKCREES